MMIKAVYFSFLGKTGFLNITETNDKKNERDKLREKMHNSHYKIAFYFGKKAPMPFHLQS